MPINIKKMGPLVQVPFMSSNERFERTSNLGAPGPGAYNPKGKIAISNEKIDALRNRNFGVNAERFESFDEKEAKFKISIFLRGFLGKSGTWVLYRANGEEEIRYNKR